MSESDGQPSAKMSVSPSSSTTGFFQERPKLGNQLHDDVALGRVLQLYLPKNIRQSILPSLSSFGDAVLTKQVLIWVADAEKNIPYLKTWDMFGRRKDELVTSEGWRNLQNLGIQEGIIAIPYENREKEYSRVHQFLKYHIWSASSAYVICPSAMTDGAACLLLKHLKSEALSPSMRPVLTSAFRRLTSRNPDEAWTSGQWMTERKGGSDVSGTETLAALASRPLQSKGVEGSPLGPYSISGFKWFSSATDANMTILLARTPEGAISTFYAPMRRTVPSPGQEPDTELNGVTIQRLKSKLGTRAVPTAELELKDMRAYLLGTAGQGIHEIATILNITRVHNSVTAMGLWGRGLAITRAYARVRVVGKKTLMEFPAHVATMAGQEVEYRGYMHLTFFTVLLLGVAEQDSKPSLSSSAGSSNTALAQLLPAVADAPLLLRVLTPLIKALTAKASIKGLSECMESLGGVGYLENEEMEFNIPRLSRDAAVLSIWEGTTDIMAHDLLRAAKGKLGNAILNALERWVRHVGEAGDIKAMISWISTIQAAKVEDLAIDGRSLMLELARIVGGVLLMKDYMVDQDDVVQEVASRWINGGDHGRRVALGVKERSEWDRRIVFGKVGKQTSRL